MSRVTVTPLSPSLSISSSSSLPPAPAHAREGYPVEGSERDVLDAYYEVTGSRPWGRPVAAWLLELEYHHGLANVEAALIVEATDPDRKRLVDRTAARLEAQAHRVKAAEARQPKPVDPLLAEQRAAYEARYGPETAEVAAEPDPDAVAAGRAAFEALRGNLGTGRRGIAQPVGAVLGSGKGAEAARPKLSLTADEGSDTESAAARIRKGPSNGSTTPSPGVSLTRRTQRGSRRSAEPGERMTDPPHRSP